MAREYFHAYHSFLKSMEELNDAECGRLFRACLTYSMTGEAQKLPGNERILFPTMKGQIDRDKEAYAEKCRKQSLNIRKRWDTTEYDGIPTIPTYTDDTKTKEKEKTKDIPPSISPPRFKPPTVDEVRAYCSERGNRVDPQTFVDFYISKGWRVGGQGMKDWKAAVRTWEKRDEKPQTVKNSRATNHSTRKYTPEELSRIGVDLIGEQEGI